MYSLLSPQASNTAPQAPSFDVCVVGRWVQTPGGGSLFGILAFTRRGWGAVSSDRPREEGTGIPASTAPSKAKLRVPPLLTSSLPSCFPCRPPFSWKLIVVSHRDNIGEPVTVGEPVTGLGILQAYYTCTKRAVIRSCSTYTHLTAVVSIQVCTSRAILLFSCMMPYPYNYVICRAAPGNGRRQCADCLL